MYALYICMYKSRYRCTDVHMYICTYVHMCIRLSVCLPACMHACMHVCMYVKYVKYVYIHMHMHIHIDLHIRMHTYHVHTCVYCQYSAIQLECFLRGCSPFVSQSSGYRGKHIGALPPCLGFARIAVAPTARNSIACSFVLNQDRHITLYFSGLGLSPPGRDFLRVGLRPSL